MRRILFCVALSGIFQLAQAQPSIQLTAPFEVVIGHRGPLGSEPIALMGNMQMTLYGDGSIVGKLTPGRLESGQDLPAVVFRGDPLRPDASAPKEIPFIGSVNGIQIGFQFDLGIGADGDPMVVSGVGTTKVPLLKLGSDVKISQGWALGKAIGPSAGDEGTWSGLVGVTPPPGGSVATTTTVTTTVCTTVYNANGTFHCRICQTVNGSPGDN